MLPDRHVWIFSVDSVSSPGGVFTTKAAAESWIRSRRLSGMLTAFPLDEGCFDWAMRLGLVTGRARERGDDPAFVATFSCGVQEHIHFVDGHQR